MRRSACLALGVLALLACSRHFVVEPAQVAGLSDTVWTIHQEPESRPTFAGRERISFPSGPLCNPGILLSENAVVLYLEASAESAGLRRGDVVTSVDRRRVRDRAEFLALVQRRRSGGELELVIARGSTPVVLRCTDGRPYADAVQAMQQAADEERWEECVRWGVEAQTLRVRSAGVVAWQAYCEGERVTAAGMGPTAELADLVYETLHLAILEAQYDPAGAEVMRAYVENGIAWLTRTGFSGQAEALGSELRPDPDRG